MSNYGTLLLSRVIDANDVSALARHGISEQHFGTDAERNAYKFIRKYAEQNRGQAPSYAAVVEEVSGFYYIPQVSESYEYLTRKLMNDSAVAEFTKFSNEGELLTLFDANYDDMPTFFDKLTERLDTIKLRTDVRNKVGTDVKADNTKFLEEYDRRKAGESFKTYPSKFSSIGDYVSGNMYVVYGKSGRGKSVITLEEVVEMAINGANVLVWAMEMPWFEVLVRIYVSVSARKQLTSLNVGGLNLNGGFDASDIRKGQLTDEFDVAFRFFIDTINDEIKGNITVRGVSDDDFNNRSLTQLESDIIHTKADVVMIDPFYYMTYEKNESRTSGGDAAKTSEELRKLIGRMQVVGFAITQADETAEVASDDGVRELDLPKRKDVSKTKQLMQDASVLIAVDTDYKQGRGLVGVNKGRDGGEGDFTEILYVPQIGVVREFEVGESAVSDFDF